MNEFDGEMAELHRLQVDYGRDWRIWRSAPTPSGRSGWYATRRRRAESDPLRGLWPTLGAEDAEDLRQQLAGQSLPAGTPDPASASSHTDTPIPHGLLRYGVPGYGSYMLPEAFE